MLPQSIERLFKSKQSRIYVPAQKKTHEECLKLIELDDRNVNMTYLLMVHTRMRGNALDVDMKIVSTLLTFV